MRPHAPSVTPADQSHGHATGERGRVTVVVNHVIRTRRCVDVRRWTGIERIFAPLSAVTIAAAVMLDVDSCKECAAFVGVCDIIARGWHT